MKILVVKTSSLGDVVHVLTAIREAKQNRPDIQIDWLIEKNFADIAHLAQQDGYIHTVIPIAFRQWRKKKPLSIFFHPAIKALKQQLQNKHYDLVIDAQGLLKSVYLAKMAKTPIVGLDKHSAREPAASYFYHKSYFVERQQHAIQRLRKLFAQALDYPLPKQIETPVHQCQNKNILLFHGTTWDNKHYPISRWRELVEQLQKQGHQILLPRYTQAEYDNACAIAKGFDDITILPRQSLPEMIETIKTVASVISVDTGLAHLSAYLGIPTIALFGPTNPYLTGVTGKNNSNLSGLMHCAPCLKRRCRLVDEQHQQQAPCMLDITAEQILKKLNTH